MSVLLLMSLDYILVKSRSCPRSLAELEVDGSFGLEQYRALAERFFQRVEWQSDGTGSAQEAGVFVELYPSDASLSLACRGDGDLMAVVDAIAVAAYGFGVVTIDVQSSSLVAPDRPFAESAGVAWYKRVLSGVRR